MEEPSDSTDGKISNAVEVMFKVGNEVDCVTSDKCNDDLKNLHEAQGSLTEVEYLQKAVYVYEKHGKHADALLKAIELILCLYETKSRAHDLEEFEHWEKTVIRNGRAITQLSNTIDDQDVLTQLYILGGSLQRNKNYSLASYVFKVAVLTHEQLASMGADNLESNNILAMKMLFQTAQCQKALKSVDQCITHLKLSLSMCLQNNDVAFEVKVLFELAGALLDEKVYDESVAYYLLLRNAKNDILNTINDSQQISIDIGNVLPADSEEIILSNLIKGYQALRLHGNALKYCNEYKSLLQNLQLENNLSSALAFKLTQVNQLLAQIHSSLGDFNAALSCIHETLTSLKPIMQTSFLEKDTANLYDIANGFKAEGEILMKMGNHTDAGYSFEMVNNIARLLGDDMLSTISYLLLCSSCLGLHQVDESKKLFKQALQLSEAIGNDRMELKCYLAESEIYAEEHKYSYALYHAERGLALAARKDDKDMIQEFRVQVGKYSQHSTSEKELSCGVLILFVEIADLEQSIYQDRVNGVTDDNVGCDIDNLYKALEVSLHRLNENKLSLAIAECKRRRLLNQSSGEKPQLPMFHLNKDFSWNNIADRKAISFLDPDDILEAVSSTVYISYSICDCGFLAHIMKPGFDVAKSYLLSNSSVKPLNIIHKIKQLLSILRGESNGLTTQSSMCDIYNTEHRTFPRLEQHCNVKSLAKDVPDENDGVEAAKEPPAADDSSDSSIEHALQQLYIILMKPLSSELNKLPEQSEICIVADSFLNKVPFEQLIGDEDDWKCLGEHFKVSTSFSLKQLNASVRLTPQREDTVQSPRQSRLLQCFDKVDDYISLHAAKLDKEIDGLISKTATGTHITTSSRYETPYMQKITPLRCCVIGAPRLNKTLQLDGKVWRPKPFLPQAYEECEHVGEYLDVVPAVGIDATKHRFLYELSNSTVMHVSTYASIERGLLAFVADDFPEEQEPYPRESYLVSEEDLLKVKQCSVDLVVISSGHGWSLPSLDAKMSLPSVLLSIGVKCVLYLNWSVPDCVMQTFFYHFYISLQSACAVSKALYNAKLKTKESYEQPKFWNAFTIMGKDVIVDLSKIRSAQMHQKLSKEEEGSILISSPLVTEERSRDQCFHDLQVCVARVSGCLDPSNGTEVLAFLLGLLEEATDRLANDDNADKPVIILPENVIQSKGTLELLQLLGFDFQSVSKHALPLATGSIKAEDLDGDAQMAIFPHWNQDNLLLPAHRVLTGLHELSSNRNCLHAVANLLPLSQSLMCMAIDLLAVLHHSPEMQLRTSDLAVQQLWAEKNIRNFLRVIGIASVCDLVIFQRSLKNRALVIGSLQLLVSLSLHRNHEILERLNISSLGQSPSMEKLSKQTLESVDPIIMPRNEIFIRSAWMKDGTYEKEKEERKKLAKHIAETNERFTRTIDHTKWWHRSVVIPRKLNSQEVVPPPTPDKQPFTKKVKVKPGATPSCTRIVINEEKQPQLGIHETLKKREEARSILNRRCVELEQRFASTLRAAYLPYVKDPSENV